jgi:predicted nucleic acid-binding protein
VIILDTNVLSALMRAEPDAAVAHWLDRQPIESLWITTISIFEARFGIALLPSGRRRQAMDKAFEAFVAIDLDNRVLDFDIAAAREAAVLAAVRRKSGRTIDFRDTQIAGITLARRASLATRNTKHFQDLQVPLIDPWDSRAR